MTTRSRPPAARLTAGQVLAWRMARQGIHPIGSLGVVETVRRMAGAQAQVQSSAELAIALRRRRGRVGDAAAAIAGGNLVRTWAMRGTLHVLEPEQAGALLSLLASGRRWETPAWRAWTGLGPREMDRLIDAARGALEGRVLTREELIEEIAQRTGSRALEEHLRSGWGGILKPLAWMGHLCNGPARSGRVTFTRPDTWVQGWRGLPPADEAARTAIPAYLAAHGPATPRTIHAWLGYCRSADVRRWLALLEDSLVEVEIDGEPCLALAADIDELRCTRAARSVRLLSGFDHYLLGPGTADPRIVASHRRRVVSRTAGWISPVVLAGGRVAGVWRVVRDELRVAAFPERRRLEAPALAAEARRVGYALGRELRPVIAAHA